MRKTCTLMALLLMLIGFSSLAQERKITGKVISSEDNLGIPGVSIIIEGTQIGTTTDAEGSYSLVLTAKAEKLRVSALGMKTKIIPITASNDVDIKMEVDVLRLDEVVVTALGISREKKSVNYSTQQINSSSVNNQGQGNVINEMQGKVSGMTVISSSGDPGSGAYIRLRGVTSLTGNNQPLFVVDGIPIDNSINNYDPTNAGFGASGASGSTTGGVSPDNRAFDINPSDIASITILKGPAATALYGIAAASGAIIITTKKGGVGATKKGGPVVEYSSSYSVDKANKLPELQSKWAQGSNGIYYSPFSGASGRRLTWGPALTSLSRTGVANEWDPNGNVVLNSDPTAAIPVTAYDPLDFFQNGSTANNNASFTGGNDKAGYRFSLGNIHQKGIIPLTKSDKTNLSLSGSSVLSSKLTITGSMNYIKTSSYKAQQGSNVSGVMLGLLRTPPTFDNSYGLSDPANNLQSYTQPDGSQRNYRGGVGYDNPYWTVNRNPYNQDVDRVLGSAQLDYKLMSWMGLTYRFGGDVYSQSVKNAFDIHSSGFPQGSIYLIDYFNKQFVSDFIINMNHRFNDDWNGNLILGHNYTTLNSSNRFTQGDGFALPSFFDMSNATSFRSTESEGRKRTRAYYGEAQLDYKSQVYLSVTGRQETTSTLANDKNVFFYPSASLGWVFTDAIGLTDNKYLPYGKARISFAQVGKDAPIQGLQTYYTPTAVNDGFTNGINFPFNGYSGYATASPISVIGNPNLKPEKTNSIEGGVDLTLFQGKATFSATYYHSKTSDQIFTVPISYATGYASALLNAGSITNKGIELSLTTTPVKTASGLKWDVTFNWSKNTSLVNELYSGVDNLFIAGFENGGIYAVKGQPFGVIFGSRFERVDPKDPNSAYLINDDPNDPGYGMPIPGSKNDIVGNVNPKWIGSALSNLSYKGINFSFQIDIRHGGDIWNGTRGALSYFGTSKESEIRGETKTFDGNLGHIDVDGNVVHFAPDNVTELSGAGGGNTNVATLNQFYWQNIGSSFIGPAEPSVEDGSFVRIRQISLGYSIPKSLISKAHIQGLTITVFANNAKLWTKYKGVDPETSLAGPANGQGLDYFNNPGIKSYGVRLNVSF